MSFNSNLRVRQHLFLKIKLNLKRYCINYIPNTMIIKVFHEGGQTDGRTERQRNRRTDRRTEGHKLL